MSSSEPVPMVRTELTDSGIAEIIVLDASPEAIAALPGMSPAKLDAFLSQRESLPPDPELVLGALGGTCYLPTRTGLSNKFPSRSSLLECRS